MTSKRKGRFSEPAPSLWFATLTAVLLGSACGCGTQANHSVNVSGVVTLDGVPLPGAKVTYYPASGGSPALGVTDGAGKFELTTFDTKTLKSTNGALPGEYKVTVEMVPAAGGRNPGSVESIEAGHLARPKPSGQKGGGSAQEPKVLHANYTDVEKTPLKQMVPPQGAVELRLTKSGT